MSDTDPWLPRFEKRDDHWVVHFAGQEWWLLTTPKAEETEQWAHTWGARHNFHPFHKVELSFQMALHPPTPDLSIPDNIILGDN
ncbi:hypothetical protein [Mycobacterium intracellulare]|uniref:Uncharacterized protein n=1 Tax=Mycobacterium intracellulare TaxID=1767 RepID=A0AAE4U7P6_MYCIT|nr:hypothetical protein [Mycobacterium intracellulare]MDV6975273.1 hypothetical protein [Mycobacterium intracellulare]MDV6980337.1 hypothetical protein [Mycobacterium intracellulare]MDV7010766.1 hypothetical protein [Mycobacterium intracellulare]MDV7025672.1 hypothetical protein [Mycobacterium intracellulare]